MKNYKIAIINSSSFGKYFPNHLERLEKIGEVKHFTFENNIPGKELAEALQDFNIVIASVRPFFNKEFFDNKNNRYYYFPVMASDSIMLMLLLPKSMAQ